MKKKKRTSTLIILLFACGFLFLAYFAIINRSANDGNQANIDPGRTTILASADTTKVKEVSFSNSSETVGFYLGADKTWKLSADPDCPIGSSLVSTLVAAVVNVESVEKVKDPSALSDYGLDTPSYSFSFTTDTAKYAFDIGIRNSFNDSYYIKAVGSDDIHMIKSDFLTNANFDRGLYDFVVSDTSTIIPASNITSLVISEDGNETEFTDADMIAAAAAISLTSCVDYSADDAELELYGLASPTKVKINYFEERKVQAEDYSYASKLPIKVELDFAYYIGGSDGEGNVYIKMQGSKMVYKITSEAAEIFTSALTPAEQ